MTFITRMAKMSDIPELAKLFDAYRTFYHQTPDIKKAEEFLAQRFKQQQSTIFVAQQPSGSLIGFVQLYPIFSSVNAQQSLLLNDLYVSESARRGGIGKALMEKAREYAQNERACWIMLQTTNENIQAQHLYESLGFQVDSQSRYYYLLLS